VAICAQHDNDPARYEEVFKAIESELGDYPPVHAINNAAMVAAALLLGLPDFERVITLAVMAGWDTDCNGATAGSIAGAVVGVSRIPPKWTGPLGDSLQSGIVDYDPIPISELAKRHVELHHRAMLGRRYG